MQTIQDKMEFDQNESFWAQEKIPGSSALEQGMEVDVAIVGGGYTGLSTAYNMLKQNPGKKVVVLEALKVGHGASGRNGSLLLAQPESEFMRIGSDPKTHKLTYEITVENINWIAELMNCQGFGSYLRMCGNMKTMVSKKHADRYKKYFDQAVSLGMPLEYKDREQTISELGTDVYEGAVYDPNGGVIHPMKLVHALKNACEEAGALIFENSPVVKIKEGETLKLSVGKSNTKVSAQALVLATNAYTPKTGFFKNGIMPVHTRVAATSPISDETFRDMGWSNRVPFFDSRNRLFHLGTSIDNRIVIGAGGAEYFFKGKLVYKKNIQAAHDILQNELNRIYPQLDRACFDYVWTGVLAFSLDFTQTVGVGGKHGNIYHGLSYCGHGINCSVLFGRIISDLYSGQADKWRGTPFLNNKLPFVPPEPFRYIGINSFMQFLKTADWLDSK